MNLNRDYHLEAFNNLTAPGEDPMKTNCFQLLSVHLENPSPPLNLLNSLFSLHPELDYMITLLPRLLQLSALEVTLNPFQIFFLCLPFTCAPSHPCLSKAGSGTSRGAVSGSQGFPPPGCAGGACLLHPFAWHSVTCCTGRSKLLETKLINLPSLQAVVPGLLQDVRHSLDTDGSDATALVLLLHGQVVGVAVVRTEWEAAALATHYSVNLGPNPVRLHHLLLAPVFQRLARHFLSQLLRQTNSTALTHPLFRTNSRCKEAARCSSLSVLDELSMATPRSRLHLSGMTRQTALPKIMPPFSLFTIDLAAALLPVRQDTRRVVVIGTGPAATAAIESLTAAKLVARPNLWLVSRDEVGREHGPSVLNMAPPLWGRGSSMKASRLSLKSVARVVQGSLCWLDRANCRVGIEDKEGKVSPLSYDILLVCIERTHYSLGLGRNRDPPPNYCVPDSLEEAANCLRSAQTFVDAGREGYIIVLGLNLHALAVVNSLIEAGAAPSCILLVKTQECTTGGSREAWHEDTAIRNRVLASLRLIGVRVKAYSIVDLRREKHRGTIDAVIFSKGEELVEAGCLLLVNCTNPCLRPRIARVLEDADFVYLQGGLVVDTEGGTNDPHVWAGGSATRLGRVALAAAGGREPLLSPDQVGRRLARAVMGVEEEEEEEASSFPIHREAQLPGGLTYLYLASGEATHARLSTSNEETGEFRLTFDKRERVSCMHCLARGHIPSSHLASLRGETNIKDHDNDYGSKKRNHQRHSSSAAGTF